MKNSQQKKIDSEPEASSETANTLSFATPELSDGKLGKIQEILFGEQLRCNAEQLESLHSNFAEQIAALNQEYRQQVSSLENRLADAEAELDRRIEANNKQQSLHLADVTSRLDTTEFDLIARIAMASEGASEAQNDIQAQLNQSNEQLSDRLESTRNEIFDRLEQAIDALESEKVDRNTLSSLLGGVVEQLSGLSELSVPKDSAA